MVIAFEEGVSRVWFRLAPRILPGGQMNSQVSPQLQVLSSVCSACRHAGILVHNFISDFWFSWNLKTPFLLFFTHSLGVVKEISCPPES